MSGESVADYGKRLRPSLAAFVSSERKPEVEEHLEEMFWLYSYVVEDFETKISRNKELCRSFFPMMVEIQDLMRGALVCQQNNLLASASLTLRTVFEIYVNAKFIFESSDPMKYLQRLIDFATCEELLGHKLSPALKSPPKEVEADFAKRHPYWATKDQKLKDSPIWNGEGKSLKTLCEDLKLGELYFRLYKPTSKFVHGSPVVRNLYRKGNAMGAIAPQPQTMRMTLLTADLVHKFLKDSCAFFGVPLPAAESNGLEAEFNGLATKF